MRTDAHFATASVRSEIYKLLSELTTYPGDSLLQAIKDGSIDSAVKTLRQQLPYPVTSVSLNMSEDCHAGAEYLRLFELPGESQPCPLYGGLFESDRKSVMEELLRYYRHFGLSIRDAEVKDTPDSISTVLEFLYYLCLLESKAENLGAAENCRSAHRDLLKRHVTLWTPKLLERLLQKTPIPFYATLFNFLNNYCQGELDALQS